MSARVDTFGGSQGAPAIVATGAVNALAVGGHATWAFFRAEASPLADSPFRLPNGTTATFGRVRTLPPTLLGASRLAALAERALNDLTATTPSVETELLPGNTGVFVALSEYLGDTRDPYFGDVRRMVERRISEWLVARGQPTAPRVHALGHASVGHALADAGRALRAGTLDAAIVLGVDSYYDPLIMDILAEEGRVFDGESPDAFIPGEGAAALLLTTRRGAKHFRLEPHALVDTIATAEEPATMRSDLPCRADGLTRVLRAITARLGTEGLELEWMLGDLTNESYRAREYQLAFPRAIAPGGLDTGGKSFRNVASDALFARFVPTGFGDLGAATLATACVLACEGFRRGEPDAASCALVGSSVGKPRAAILLRRP